MPFIFHLLLNGIVKYQITIFDMLSFFFCLLFPFQLPSNQILYLSSSFSIQSSTPADRNGNILWFAQFAENQHVFCNCYSCIASLTFLKLQAGRKKNNLKFSKSANLIKILLRSSMSNLHAVGRKTRKIVKKAIRSRDRLKIRDLKLQVQKVCTSSPDKSSSIHEAQTNTQGYSPKSAQDEPVSSNLNYFQSYNPYTLGSINSIVFNNGRIYDLLFIKKKEPFSSKPTKCRCSKSQCSAKYCDCFANGEACGSSCQCSGCLNTISTDRRTRKSEERFCNCAKSGCIKKYCECFQRGDSCSSKCHCENCKNTSGQCEIPKH